MADWLTHPLVTAIMGFMGGMWGLIGLELWRERRRAVLVRTMLRQEIAQNVASLTALHHQWSPAANEPRPGPALERLVWTAQMPVIPSVLGDQEFVVLSSFYDGLLRISVLNDALAPAEAPPAVTEGGQGERSGSGSLVEQRLAQIYADIRTLIPRTIQAGTLGCELLSQPH